MVFDTDYQCDRRTNSTTVGLYAVTVLVFVCCGKTEPQEPARINQEWTGLCWCDWCPAEAVYRTVVRQHK